MLDSRYHHRLNHTAIWTFAFQGQMIVSYRHSLYLLDVCRLLCQTWDNLLGGCEATTINILINHLNADLIVITLGCSFRMCVFFMLKHNVFSIYHFLWKVTKYYYFDNVFLKYLSQSLENEDGNPVICIIWCAIKT